MIPKSEKRFSEKIMLKQKSWSGTTIRRKVITLQSALNFANLDSSATGTRPSTISSSE